MSTVRDCVKLIERYLAGDLGPWDFTTTYLRTYRDVPTMSEDLFQVLETVFGVAEGYDPSVTPETQTVHDFTEETLRSTCMTALASLRTTGPHLFEA